MTYYDLQIVSWDGTNINDGTNYEAGFNPALEWGLPDIDALMVGRTGAWPVVGGIDRKKKTVTFSIRVVAADKRTARDELLQIFDPEDETPKQLIIEDEDGSNDRYIEGICESIRPITVGGLAVLNAFEVTIAIDGDVRWRKTTTTTDTWQVSSSPTTHTVNNPGTDEAYPIITITPDLAKTGGFEYKQFIPIVWRSPNPGPNYPIEIEVDTETLITNTKLESDCADLRVFVDGKEVDRWIPSGEYNQSDTSVWFVADWEEAGASDLVTAIGAGSIDSIEIGPEVEDFPNSGLVLINTEVLSYTGRDLVDEKLTGITRAVKGSSEGTHAVDDTVYWIQHDIYLAYGNSSLTNPPYRYDTYEPMFSLTYSSNTLWSYNSVDGFGSYVYKKRTGAWQPSGTIVRDVAGGCYTYDDGGVDFLEYTHVGVRIYYAGINAYAFVLENPCGIINADWAGEYYHSSSDPSDVLWTTRYWIWDENWWTKQYEETGSGITDDTWTAWTQAAGAAWDEASAIGIMTHFWPGAFDAHDVDVTLSSDYTPSVDTTSCAEQGNYQLDATIENVDTGDIMYVSFDMAVDSSLEIDTLNEMVTYLEDGTNQFKVVSFNNVRKHWLKLISGDNDIKFTDSGTNDVDIEFEFTERYY